MSHEKSSQKTNNNRESPETTRRIDIGTDYYFYKNVFKFVDEKLINDGNKSTNKIRNIRGKK